MAERQNGEMAEWRNGGMAEWRNGGMVEWQNSRMTEWQNGRLAEWRNGGMVEWWNGGMAEWHNVRYKIVQNQDTESTQMPLWRSPSWLVSKTDSYSVSLIERRTASKCVYFVRSKLFYSVSLNSLSISCTRKIGN